MPMQTWVAHVGGPGPGVAGTALANTTTETDISPVPAIVIPANMLDYIGAKLRISAFGVYSTTTGPPTLKLSLYPNAVAGGNALTTSGAVNTTASVTNVPWRLEWEGVLRSIGSAGTMMGCGTLHLGASVSAYQTSPAGILPLPNTALATTTINTTQNNTITVAAQWGTASASNTVTCHDLSVLSLA